MSGMKSVVVTLVLAGAIGLGVVALVAEAVGPGGSLHASVQAPSSAVVPALRSGGDREGDAAAAPRALPAAGSVVREFSVALADDVVLDACVVLGPRVAAAGGEERQLVALCDFRLHGFTLQTSRLNTAVPADDRARRSTGAEFDLNRAGRSAAELLAAAPQSGAPPDPAPQPATPDTADAATATTYAAVRMSPYHSVHFAPRAGLTWGDVAAEADLELSVTHEP